MYDITKILICFIQLPNKIISDIFRKLGRGNFGIFMQVLVNKLIPVYLQLNQQRICRMCLPTTIHQPPRSHIVNRGPSHTSVDIFHYWRPSPPSCVSPGTVSLPQHLLLSVLVETILDFWEDDTAEKWLTNKPKIAHYPNPKPAQIILLTHHLKHLNQSRMLQAQTEILLDHQFKYPPPQATILKPIIQ